MTIYLTGSFGKAIRPHLDSRRVGVIVTPKMGNILEPHWIRGYDNGCFNAKTYVGDERWFAWLCAQQREHALFATAPDVLGDAKATLWRSEPWLWRIREAGFPAALVAQNGLEHLSVPWDLLDVLFIGGDTPWKMGPAAAALAQEANARGKKVHCGRVNSLKRMRHCQDVLGAQSADGTFLAFGPDINVPKLLGWLDVLDGS